MTSHAPAQCCTIGVRHEGTPSGKIETVEDGRESIYLESLIESCLFRDDPNLCCFIGERYIEAHRRPYLC